MEIEKIVIRRSADAALAIEGLLLTVAWILFFALGHDAHLNSSLGFRFFLLMQMAIAVCLAGLFRWGFYNFSANSFPPDIDWRRASNLGLIAIGLCYFGDLINSRIIDLTAVFQAQTILSIPFFAAAHILYIISFFKIGRVRMSKGVLIKALPLCLTLSVIVWLSLVDRNADPIMTGATFVYSFIVIAMAMLTVWIAKVYGKPGVPTAVGGVLFVISDGIIGAYLPVEAPMPVTLIIWTLYLIAQLLIIRTFRIAFSD